MSRRSKIFAQNESHEDDYPQLLNYVFITALIMLPLTLECLSLQLVLYKLPITITTITNITCGIRTKIRLYEAVILSTLLYGSETSPMTVANEKKLDAAHNKWLRRTLHISWRDKITNKAIWKRTGQEDMGNII